MNPPKIAVAQMSSVPAGVEQNINAACRMVRNASQKGARLIVFPECTLTGYLFDRREDIEAAAFEASDRRLEPLLAELESTATYAVVGLLERDENKIFNTALVIGPDGIIGRYRKQHLPMMGADRFVDAGEGGEPRVFDLGFLRVGVMICFDLRFPESARELALEGADVIAMPTNWPKSASLLANEVLRVRALENFVYIAVADRADQEFGRPFFGGSRIVAPSGEILAATSEADGIIMTKIDVNSARTKEIYFGDMGYGISLFESRRPLLYTSLTKQR